MTIPVLYSQARRQIFTEEELQSMSADNRIQYERLSRLRTEEQAEYFHWSVRDLAFKEEVINHPCWDTVYANRIRELLVVLRDENVYVEVFNLGAFWVYHLHLNTDEQWKIMNESVYTYQVDQQLEFARVTSDKMLKSVIYKARSVTVPPIVGDDEWWISNNLLGMMIAYWSAKKYLNRLNEQFPQYLPRHLPVIKMFALETPDGRKLVDLSGLTSMHQYSSGEDHRLGFRYDSQKRDYSIRVESREQATRFEEIITDEIVKQGLQEGVLQILNA